MKKRIKQVFSFYFNSKWVPTMFFLASLVVLIIASVLPWKFDGTILFISLAVTFIGISFASIWNFIKRRWSKGLVNLAMLPICLFIAFATSAAVSILGPSGDGFADNLKIPDDIVISEPAQELPAKAGGPEDTFQTALLAAIKNSGNDDATVAADINSLVRLQNKNPEILKRYLATSPAWRVFKEDGGLFATRRWMIDSEWCYTLHGYYTKYDVGMWSEMPYFQSRFTIGLSGKPWARISKTSTKMQQGEVKPLTLSTGNQMHGSHCVITGGDIIVEIFEQSKARERRLTKTALVYLENEMAPLAGNPSWETIRTGLPPEIIKRGEASFELRKSSQPGIYDSYIWVNPGESGMIYLKAFEVTHEKPLSVDRLKETSNEWIGWSDSPEDLFFSNTNFTIYEGDWGKPYAARFEVWFVPDSGSLERKLMEKIFKIEGWQR